MIYDSIITLEPYGTKGACKPWHSLDAMERPKYIPGAESQEDVNFCASCNVPEGNCKGQGARCGVWQYFNSIPDGMTTKPRGYDRATYEAAAVRCFSRKALAKALGITPLMAQRWEEWHDEERV